MITAVEKRPLSNRQRRRITRTRKVPSINLNRPRSMMPPVDDDAMDAREFAVASRKAQLLFHRYGIFLKGGKELRSFCELNKLGWTPLHKATRMSIDQFEAVWSWWNLLNRTNQASLMQGKNK